MRPTASVLTALVVTLVIPIPTARAYEDQWGLSATAGYQLTRSLGEYRHGVEVGAVVDYGLSDTWTVRGRLDYALSPAQTNAPQPLANLHTWGGGAELIYVLDILTVVPYFGGGLGLLGFAERGHFALRPAVHLVAGMDYLLNREWSIGAELRCGATARAYDDRPFVAQVLITTRYVIDD